ncbi:FxSxx-COOH system tetratricopeptide repeat protein [Actinoplanes sp. NPDC023936]|uniref:FxSxx-COOH system tetratricopeptide repeat protein n=1 Tax=Actinoplanes sp. NPDC023936 TaxID=3154910 RepID=UPI0033C3DE11
MGLAAGNRRIDVFISYAGPDRPWANWAAQQLERAGMSVELTAWDWSAGDNFVLRMNDALGRADRVLALYSAAYFAPDRFTTDEWVAVLAAPPDERGRRLVPVRVEEVTPPPILRAVTYRDVFGLPEQRARQVLLEAVTGRARPSGDVRFPGGSGIAVADVGVRVPGSLPRVWNVRRRNPAFTGRSRELALLRERLCSGERALVQALHGIGGVGKTELAVEYAHLFGNEYDLVWWIDAEHPELVGEQLAALTAAANWGEASGADVVLRRLQRESGWLLIYDNAKTVDAVATMIPSGGGHVVITSRSRQTGGVASAPIGVDLLGRAASTRLVREVAPTLRVAEADRLAGAVGDLPLALGQAAGLVAETGMSVDEYLAELSANPAELLDEGPTGRYPRSLAAVITASMRHLSGQDEAAGQLMRLAAVLAPEPMPLSWLTGTAAESLPEPLAAVATSTIARRRMLGRIAAVGLARVDADTMQLHRLTRAVIAPTTAFSEAEHADRLLTAAAPIDERDPDSWPRWAVLLPHLLARAKSTTSPELRVTAGRALYYLVLRGEYRTAQNLATDWHQHWQRAVGPNDPSVLRAANQLANTYLLLGEYEQARRLHEDTFVRRRRVLGDDHPDTLRSANNLANSWNGLTEYEQARELHEDTLDRLRQVLGDDDPDTLRSASSLASSLHELGEYEQARELNEDTLARRRRVLGDDHPDTLRSASYLAINLHKLGEYEPARHLNEDTLVRRRRVLGDDHPDTVASSGNLASDLHELGEYEQARGLHEDTLARRRRVLGDDHPDALSSANDLASTLQKLGEHERASRLLAEIAKRSRAGH